MSLTRKECWFEMNTTDTSAGSISRKARKRVGVFLFTAVTMMFAVNVHASIFDDEYVEKMKNSSFAIETAERLGLSEEYNEYILKHDQEKVDDFVENESDQSEENVETKVSEDEKVLEEAENAEDNTDSTDETQVEEVCEKSVDEIAPMTDYNTAKAYANSLYSNTDLNSPSGISREDFIAYIKGMPSRHDPNGFYKRNCEYIWETCQEVGFNEFAFLGVSSWEGGWAAHGVSYNYYGTLGMRYGSEREGIYGWVSFMKNNYISSSGKYYHGPDLKHIGPTYCSSQWTYDVLSRVQDSAMRT